MTVHERVNVLGVGISCVDHRTTVTQIHRWIQQRALERISLCTVHTVMECQSNPLVKWAINGSSLAVPDGMPLVWLAQNYAKAHVSRVYGPDLMLSICEESAARGYRHYFFGGDRGVSHALAWGLSSRFPGLAVAGTDSPPYGSVHDMDFYAQRINLAEPDIVWVGLGTPKQDLWMARNRAKLRAPVLIGVGAAFDFHTGRLAQAPHWMQRIGMEWFFRLVAEPRRLWYRYLIYNPLFLILLLQQALGLRRFE